MEVISQTYTKIIANAPPRTYKTLASVTPIPQIKLILKAKNKRWIVASRCVTSESGYVSEMEPITPEELTQKREICGEEGCELLDYLEREAITGNDDGREPTDYNRRAKIFDKSSKVFKNLKEQKDQPPMEYLEKEAIMEADDGRDPTDYNRRAKIFDKNSKIFKNIKEHRDQSPE